MLKFLLLVLVSFSDIFLVPAYSAEFCKRSDDMPETWIDKVSPVVSFFETSAKAGYGKITNDFDCQGLSAGVLQWNIGKESLQPLLRAIAKKSPSMVQEKMGNFSREFFENIKPISTRRQLEWVRSYQSFLRPNTCDAGRGATWTSEGIDFSNRLSALMSSPVGRMIQRKKISSKLEQAYGCSKWWSEAQERNPTIEDTAFFYDTLTFNGTWWKNRVTPKKVRLFIEEHGGYDGAFAVVIDYLHSQPDERQLQSQEAKLNADLWQKMHREKGFTNQQIELLVFSYLISNAIENPPAKKFKFLVISRRGTILFGKGYVNGTRNPVTVDLSL